MDATNHIVPKAAKSYFKGEYVDALNLYKEAAQIYGDKFFEINIALCKRGIFEHNIKIKTIAAEHGFLSTHNDVYKKINSKSEKYKKINEMNAKVGKQPRSKELTFLIEYASQLRSIQMSETYIGVVRFLIKNALKIELSSQNNFLKHVRNAFLLSGDEKVLLELKEVDESLLKKVTLPYSVISNLNEQFTGLLRVGSTINDLVFDFQSDKGKLLTISKSKEFKDALDEQQKGVMLNYYSILNDEQTYKKELNDLFAKNGLSSVESLSLNSENFLSTIVASKTNCPLRLSEKSPLITVIMSCFNSEKTVLYALGSLLKQTYNNIEILVCDDCSDDASMAKINLLASQDSRIKVFKSNENQGTYNIRNALLEIAQGEFITFHDADDWAHPQKLELQMKFVLNEGVLVCSTRWIRVDPKGKAIFFMDGCIQRFCVVSTMVHRSVFNVIPKFRQSLVAADTEFHESCVQLLGAEKVRILEKPLVLGLWGDGSLTKRDGLKAENNGHVASRRRAYSDIAARQRVLGSIIIPDDAVVKVMRENDIYRESFGVSRVGASE